MQARTNDSSARSPEFDSTHFGEFYSGGIDWRIPGWGANPIPSRFDIRLRSSETLEGATASLPTWEVGNACTNKHKKHFEVDTST